MKNLFKPIIALFVIGFSFSASSQKLEFVPMIGNVFSSTYNGYEGRIEFENGIAYGAMLNFLPNKYVEIGLNFINQETSAHFVPYYDLVQPDQDMPAGIAYYQLSLVRNFGDWERIIPFGGFDVGAVQLYERNGDSKDYWEFAVGFKGGVKIQITDRLNIRFQPQIEMPIQSFGLGVGVGTGGASVGATGWAGMVQFGIMGGLGITLMDKDLK